MTVTIDTKTLSVEGGGISENVEVVGTFMDKWQDATYGRKRRFLAQ